MQKRRYAIVICPWGMGLLFQFLKAIIKPARWSVCQKFGTLRGIHYLNNDNYESENNRRTNHRNIIMCGYQ
jgi:hypothetical protein